MLKNNFTADEHGWHLSKLRQFLKILFFLSSGEKQIAITKGVCVVWDSNEIQLAIYWLDQVEDITIFTLLCVHLHNKAI